MADEGFHEIQLNGKQLVFLFMAATVVSVVVFLLGVMVGRNVRQPLAEVAAATTGPAADPTADPRADPRADSRADPRVDPRANPRITVQSASSTGSTDRMPLSAQETLSYAERLEAPEPADETLKDPTAPTPAPLPQPASAPATARTPVPAVQHASRNEPAGNGYVVQVMAAVKREEADSLARRLTAKGYPAFVSVGDGKVPARFRVRVGKYSDKREADAVFRRLEQEEHFKPWLTR